jgi:2C-methyl-D-erythritol 2,4-cyclodiphosphate synthase
MSDAVRGAVGGAHVSITPKRGEGIGAVGRREGIQCWAVALVESGEPSDD